MNTKFTQKQIEAIKENDHVSTITIEKDIADTHREIKNYEDEKEILERNYGENKVRIYMLKGRITVRKEFIEKIQLILDYRKNES